MNRIFSRTGRLVTSLKNLFMDSTDDSTRNLSVLLLSMLQNSADQEEDILSSKAFRDAFLRNLSKFQETAVSHLLNSSSLNIPPCSMLGNRQCF